MEVPLLSVCLITYNHEKYIAQAIESVLMQKTDFSIRLIIADDCSKDNTRGIVLKYKERFPELIHLIFQEKNIGPGRNWLDLISFPKSRYIAYFEGDDYWTDPLKLQKQVDFLEQHNEIALCFHQAQVLNIKGNLKLRSVPESLNGVYTFNDLLSQTNFITSASIVYRNLLTEFPDWLLKVPYGDMGLYYLITRHGNIACLPDVMSVYRIHEGGIWSGRKKMDSYMAEYKFYQIMFSVFTGEEHETLLKKADAIIRKIAETKYPKFGIARFFCRRKLQRQLA